MKVRCGSLAILACTLILPIAYLALAEAIERHHYFGVTTSNTTFSGYTDVVHSTRSLAVTRIIAIALTVLIALTVTGSVFAQTIAANAFTVSLPMVVSAVATPIVIPTPVPDTCAAVNRQFELEVLRLINVERAKVGLSSLVEDKSLTVAARCHAIDMAANDFLSHTGSNGSKPKERVTEAGYLGNYAGEIAAGCWIGPQEVVNGWIGSASHLSIMMLPDTTDFGTGYGVNSAPVGTSSFRCNWVVNFGKR